MATTKKLMTLLSMHGLTTTRGQIVYDHTAGRTSSVRQLYQSELDQLCSFLEVEQQKQQKELDIKRKRVIAAQFAVFDLMRKKVSIAYVKACICRRASVTNINNITSNKLDNIYNSLLDAQKQLRYSGRMVEGYITEQQSYN